jgi:hypothetical protein
MTTKSTGWRTDPFGRHEARYFSLDGKPTRLVSDAGQLSHDPARRPVGPAKPSPASMPSQALQRGWRADPYGRHEARYFSLDGKPTRLVSDAGKRSHDHVALVAGLSTVLPFTAVTSGPVPREGHEEELLGEETERTNASSSDSPVVGSLSVSAMNASEPMSTSPKSPSSDPSPTWTPEPSDSAEPMPIPPESHADTNPRRHKGIVIIGATLAALAVVIALIVTNSPNGKGTPHRSASALSPTTATKASIRPSRRVTPTTASTAVPSSTTPRTTAATTTSLHATTTAETPTSRTTSTHATATHTTTTPTTSPAQAEGGLPVLTSPVTTKASTPTSTTQPLPAAPVTSFGEGTYKVGSQIVAQTYRAPGGTGCYWARLSSASGGVNDIIADDNAVGPAIVAVAPSDAAFESNDCGTWSPAPTSGPQTTSMGDGMWAVGIDIVAGTYQATSTGSCYWARLSSFSGASDAIIANGDAAPGQFTVTISPSDAGFLSSNCGQWTLVG